MSYPVPAEVLKRVREDAGLSQAALAKAMGTVASVLSKLERSAEPADPEVADRYLGVIDTDLSRDVRAYYARPWLQNAPPSFLHPDREPLWTIDQALQALAEFEVDADPILRGPIDLLRSELKTVEDYLRKREHTVAWVGDIGVGKTTALTYAVGLLVGDGRSGRRSAFPTGSGRTTVCETAIRYAATYGILVDAENDDEVVRKTRELVTSLVPGMGSLGVPTEVGRLLRNMADVPTSTDVIGDEVVTIDPILQMLTDGIGVDEVVDRVVSAMNLSERREQQIVLPEGSDDGLIWVSRLVTKINGGLDKRFSLPKRITVLMPSSNLSADGQTLSVIDTKGLEPNAQRKDITEHADNIRTLVVLCTKFADAPNASVQRHLQESIDAGSDAPELHRQCILVLPRGDEPMDLPGLDAPPPSRAVAYAIRRKDVQQTLANASLPVAPVYFYDAFNDEADRIWATLRAQIAQMRGVYAQRADEAATGVQDLINNPGSARTAEARRHIETEFAELLAEVYPFPDSVRSADQNLIKQIGLGHHSSIAASIYRRGDWESFDFAHILGTGVRNDANLRSTDPLKRIDFRLMDFERKYKDLDTVVRSLKVIRQRLNEGKQEFLATARTIGREAYGSLLEGHDAPWAKSARRYGLGSGYKRDVAEIWQEWFDTGVALPTAKAVNTRLQDAWDQWVLTPMRRATQADA